MSKRYNYLVQYDLPCYPDERPRPGRRTVCGISEDPFWLPGEKGKHALFIGGCGRGTVPKRDGHPRLVQAITRDINDHIEKLRHQLAWHERLLAQWEKNPAHFRIEPTEEG